jgi:hypothetical protein
MARRGIAMPSDKTATPGPDIVIQIGILIAVNLVQSIVEMFPVLRVVLAAFGLLPTTLNMITAMRILIIWPSGPLGLSYINTMDMRAKTSKTHHG